MTGCAPPPRFDRVVLIFNPSSSRDSGVLAGQLREALARRLPGMPVSLQPTGFAGHARTLAREAASAGNPLIVSISGDGGYNEVINGVMDAGGNAVCAVMAGGNANDHRRSTRRMPLIDAIVAGEIRRIDLLQLQVGEGTTAWTRYAHSYIGFGLTSAMAIGLAAGTKGVLSELVSVARTMSSLTPLEITRADGAHATFDSLVLANIPYMAKYGKVSETGEPNDGMFEVITLPHASRWRIVLMTLRAVTIGLGVQQTINRYEFITLDPIPLQIDGEVMNINAHTTVLVQAQHQALATLG
ncbi:diacylglycerol kinase family protein [Arthrobacter sp. 1088]|uniref:diacylglycerol/lipid kinase family protein n=1 Tax=Arthrobacter sp. 1088 TaxID=2817768 RepID=UPI002869F46F|nr:diacylglycerol kinase family protein [Arthrobacter sp. 1088]